MARVSLSLPPFDPSAVTYPSALVSSVDTSSASRPATLLAPTLLTSASTSTTVSDALTTPPTAPRTVPSSLARVTTRIIQASTPMPAVRSRPIPSLPSLWVLSAPCHTSPRFLLLPTVSPILHLSSTPPFPPTAALHLLLPAFLPAPGPPLEPVLPTPAEIAPALLPVSRSDPPSSPWVSVPSASFLLSSLWPKLGQQTYHHSIP